MTIYPKVKYPKKIGSYPGSVGGGGGFVWDAVLEYRVWCHPENGAPDLENGNDYFYCFADYEEALKYSKENAGSEEPVALIQQNEYIDEPAPGQYVHVKKKRLTEWNVEYLSRPKRTKHTISDFFSPDAPDNRLDILRGLAVKKKF